MRNAALFLLLLLMGSIGCNVYQWRKSRDLAPHGADTIRITDTVTIREPVVVESLVVRNVVKTLRVVDTISIVKNDTLVDSVQVIVPITSKMYQDTDYIAWVSGYLPRLDSIRVYRHTSIINKRERRWNFGAQAGYGVTTKGLSPYVGFGVTLRLY